MKHIFGPVGSRRLGRSLGIDLVPFKICSLNCIYCEVGATTHQTLERKEYIHPDDVLQEFFSFLESWSGELDFITFSGSGEPTLNSGLGYIANMIKKKVNTPIALLTNSTLLDDPNVRKEIKTIDVILPSLDAVSQEAFSKVNRPLREITTEAIIEGLCAIRKELTLQIWLEIMLVKGINTSAEECKLLREAIDRIKPHRVQLNTVARPPGTPHPEAIPLFREEMEKIQSEFFKDAEIIGEFNPQTLSKGTTTEEALLTLLNIRPCTIKEIIQAMGTDEKELIFLIRRLEAQEKIESQEFQGEIFYLSKKGRKNG